MERFVLIVAGGTGRRMGATIPKQFLPLCGRPLLMHTIEKFFNYDPSFGITVVLPAQHISFWEELVAQHHFSVPHKIVAGGEERFHSVKNGLDTLPEDGLVAIHDGVRPMVSADTIARCFDEADKTGAAIPVVTPSESVRMLTVSGSLPLNRDVVRLVQTPQVFSLAIIKKSYRDGFSREFTDDATVAEKSGYPVSLVEGNRENIKITTEDQLQYAETLLGCDRNK